MTRRATNGQNLEEDSDIEGKHTHTHTQVHARKCMQFQKIFFTCRLRNIHMYCKYWWRAGVVVCVEILGLFVESSGKGSGRRKKGKDSGDEVRNGTHSHSLTHTHTLSHTHTHTHTHSYTHTTCVSLTEWKTLSLVWVKDLISHLLNETCVSLTEWKILSLVC